MVEIYWYRWDNFHGVNYFGSFKIYLLPNFGVTIATEVIKNSEALQELPEKSFEVINRLLDSIASEDKKKETSF